MSFIKNKKILIICFIALLVIALVIGITVSNKNSEKKKEEALKQAEIKKRNNHLTDKKEFEGLNIENIIITRYDDKITISMDFVNNTNADIAAFNGNLVILDVDDKEIGKVGVSVNAIPKSEKTTIETDITKYYGEARDFKIEKQ